MTVLVKEEKREELAKALTQGEGKAFRRCVTVDELFSLVSKAEEQLDDLQIAPSYRIGALCEFTEFFDGRGSKWSQYSTKVTLQRRKDGWILTGVERVRVSDWHPGGYELFLTLDQDEIAVKKLRRQYTIQG